MASLASQRCPVIDSVGQEVFCFDYSGREVLEKILMGWAIFIWAYLWPMCKDQSEGTCWLVSLCHMTILELRERIHHYLQFSLNQVNWRRVKHMPSFTPLIVLTVLTNKMVVTECRNICLWCWGLSFHVELLLYCSLSISDIKNSLFPNNSL